MKISSNLPHKLVCTRENPTLRRDTLRIALVNNLSDAALHAGERQFYTLLSRASVGLKVTLDLYTLPGIVRGRTAEAHISAYYEDFRNLERNRPDGIIVTGTEPRQRRLQDEEFWPSFARLFDFTRESATSVVWCCIAAHAAVLRGDGVERTVLPNKLTGLFDSNIVLGAHDLLRGMPRRWRVPHSRRHGLMQQSLEQHGYVIAAKSRHTGPDIFLRKGGAWEIFLQCHPEYSSTSLVGEYRRDVKRFLCGEQNTCPMPPDNVLSLSVRRQLRQLRCEFIQKRDPGQLAALNGILEDVSLQASWSTDACRLYSNWLTHLSETVSAERSVGSLPVSTRSTAPARVLAEAQAAE